MHYALLFHYGEETDESLGAEAMAAGRQAFAAYAGTLEQAGILVGGQVLQPSANSTTLTLVDGEPRIQDGPFADTKEQFGGMNEEREAREFLLGAGFLHDLLKAHETATRIACGALSRSDGFKEHRGAGQCSGLRAGVKVRAGGPLGPGVLRP